MLQHPTVQVIVGQIFILLLAFVLTYYPSLYLPAILAYIGVLIAIQMIASRVTGGSKPEVLESKVLYKEEVDQEILLKDERLVEEYTRVIKATMLPSILTMVIAFAAFFLLPHILEPRYTLLFKDKMLARFATWITVFETIFGVSWALRLAAGAARVEPIAVARSFEIREKGVVIKTGPVPTVISFPLKDYEVSINEERGFVELRSKKSRSRIRLYTRRPVRVYELLKRLGFRQSPSK